MPCGDGGVPYPLTREEELNARVPMRALCAMLSAMAVSEYLNMLERIDWKEAGVQRSEFVEWWKLHQDRDLERKRRERREKPAPSTLMTFDDWIHATNNAKESGGHFMGYLARAYQHADHGNQPPLKDAYHSHFFRFLSEERRRELEAQAAES